MIKVILNVVTSFERDILYPGDSRTVPENTAQRWINRGIAHYSNKIGCLTKQTSKKKSRWILKLNIIFEGLMFGYTGFAEAVRNLAYSLHIRGCNIITKPHDKFSVKDNGTIISADADVLTAKAGKILNSLRGAVYNNNYKLVHITMTIPLGIINKDSAYQIGYVMFETQEIPKIFAESLMRNTDELWVPSTFNFKNFTEAGYSKPIFTMPLGVDTDRFDPNKVKPLDIGLKDKFIFLSIMGWSERKGISRLIEAYLREFNSKDNTVLYLKGGWYRPYEAEKEVARVISKFDKKDCPEVKIDFNLYSDVLLTRLYKNADCFVLASLGEGWGLNYTEAMSMELPTIGTRCTSQVDFMNDKNSFLIDVDRYRPEPKCNWISPYYVGGIFAIPSVGHLQQLMRQVYDNPELAKKKGKQARKDMVLKYQ